MFVDKDIKIAGERPSEDVKRNKMREAENSLSDTDNSSVFELIGRETALKFISAIQQNDDETEENEMFIQRVLLLMFTANASLEQFIKDENSLDTAKVSFLNTLKSVNPSIYKISRDGGAFSFYYLAFRRGIEVDRRIGQTFAMLCSHDGDPIYQELGEALYCWFMSVVKKIVEENIKT